MNTQKSQDTETNKSSDPAVFAEPSTEETGKGTGFLNVLLSVLASLIGVQSQKNRERDFKEGKPADFIFIGVVVVALVMVGMIVLVKLVLSSAGS